MIRTWHRLSTDWQRWARWWMMFGVLALLSWRVSMDFWLGNVALLAILPTD